MACSQCGGMGLELKEQGWAWLDFLVGDIPYAVWQCWMCGFKVYSPSKVEVEQMQERRWGRA